MAEFIDRDAVKLALAREFAYHSYAGEAACAVVDKIPAADVRPVRHGNWEKRMEQRKWNGYEAYTPVWRCSDCGKDYDPESIVNFCPNCGAKMIGGDDNV